MKNVQLILTAPLTLTLLAGVALGQNTQRVDKSTAGAIATTGSGTAFTVLDSRMAFFASTASNLLPAGQDTNGVADIFCRNREFNTTVRISVPDPSMPDAQANGASSLCHSGARCATEDGRFVVFTSEATNLVPNDTNGVSDVFVRDRDLDDNGVFDEPGVGKTRTVRVSVSSSEAQATGGCPNGTCTHYSYGGTISGDGRFVAFVSGASLTSTSVAYTNIYLRDRDADNDGVFDENGGSPDAATTTLVSKKVCCVGAQFDGFSDSPAISVDGRFVAYVSNSDHVVFGDTNTYSDIFVFDRLGAGGGTNTRVSVSTGGDDGGTGDCFSPSITASGDAVAFATARTGLVAGDTQYSDIFVRYRDTDNDGVYDEAGAVSTIMASMGRNALPFPNGSEVRLNGDSDSPSISANGMVVAFASTATNHTAALVNGDTNNAKDILARNLWFNTTERMSVTAAGVEANGASASPTASYFGYQVGFTSAATNLDGTDTNGTTSDAYVRASVPRFIDDCETVDLIIGPVGIDTFGQYADGSSTCGTSNASPDAMFSYLAPCTGTVTMYTGEASYDTVLSIHTACPGTVANEVACDDDSGAGTNSSLSFHTDAGVRYYIRVTGYNGASGFCTLYVNPCEATPCPADFNQDGGIDGSDVQAFFAEWEAGNASADVNTDGGVDGTDVEFFFAAWESGGCV
ncbi:MAG: hypothetical protein JSR77_01190 [Planctomycetes bacterium]|nr:hypothetical protein [Planctomycetota bacterium]